MKARNSCLWAHFVRRYKSRDGQGQMKASRKIKGHFYLFWGAHLIILRDFSWFYTQESFLVVLRRPYGVLETEPGLTVCKASLCPSCYSIISSVPTITCILLCFTQIPL